MERDDCSTGSSRHLVSRPLLPCPQAAQRAWSRGCCEGSPRTGASISTGVPDSVPSKPGTATVAAGAGHRHDSCVSEAARRLARCIGLGIEVAVLVAALGAPAGAGVGAAAPGYQAVTVTGGKLELSVPADWSIQQGRDPHGHHLLDATALSGGSKS